MGRLMIAGQVKDEAITGRVVDEPVGGKRGGGGGWQLAVLAGPGRERGSGQQEQQAPPPPPARAQGALSLHKNLVAGFGCQELTAGNTALVHP